MKRIVYSKSSLKTLRRMPANDIVRIRTKITQYARDPASLVQNVTSLKGSKYVRLRVGNWRVIMSDKGFVLDILEIGPRGSIYE